MSCCHAYHSGPRRYSHHENPAIRLLNAKLQELPKRSLEADIVAGAMLYLEGDLQPGHSVERYLAAHPNRTSLTGPARANTAESFLGDWFPKEKSS